MNKTFFFFVHSLNVSWLVHIFFFFFGQLINGNTCYFVLLTTRVSNCSKTWQKLSRKKLMKFSKGVDRRNRSVTTLLYDNSLQLIYRTKTVQTFPKKQKMTKKNGGALLPKQITVSKRDTSKIVCDTLHFRRLQK